LLTKPARKSVHVGFLATLRVALHVYEWLQARDHAVRAAVACAERLGSETPQPLTQSMAPLQRLSAALLLLGQSSALLSSTGRLRSHAAAATTLEAPAQATSGVDAFAAALPAEGLDRFDVFCRNVLEGGSAHGGCGFGPRNETHLPDGQLVSEYYFPGLVAKPWWRASHLPDQGVAWVAELEAARAEIAGELRTLLDQDQINFRHGHRPGNGFDVWHLDDSMVPRSMARLDALDAPYRGARSVLFCRIEPGARLETHSDYYNYVLTAHLPLFTAKRRAPLLRATYDLEEFDKALAAEPYPAFEKRGKAGMVFRPSADEATHEPWFDEHNKPLAASLVDTTFTHSAFNDNADEDIYFLHLDVWHPGLTAAERDAVRLLDETFRKLRAEGRT